METYSYTYPWLQMVRPPQPTHRGGGGNIMCTCSIFVCRHKKQWHVDLAGARTYLHTNKQTDRQTHRHTYINQYKHIVIPIHGCVCVSYPPFGGGGGEPGGAGSYMILMYDMILPHYVTMAQKKLTSKHIQTKNKKTNDKCQTQKTKNPTTRRPPSPHPKKQKKKRSKLQP